MGGPETVTDAIPKITQGLDTQAETTGVKKWLRENLMLLVTLAGVLLGVILGLGLRPLHPGSDMIMLISYPGELFMRLLKLMILPLIIASLIAGSASLNARMNGKIAVRTLIYFLLTSMLNALLGILLVLCIHPGDPGMRGLTKLDVQDSRHVNILDSLLDLGRNIFPDNLFQAAFQQAHTVYVPKQAVDIKNISANATLLKEALMAAVEPEKFIRVVKYRSGTNTLGIVFFCLMFGTVLSTTGPKGRLVIDFFQAIFEVVMKMVSSVMWLTPIGVSSVIAGKILEVDDLGTVIAQLGWFIATIAIGILFYQLVIMQLIYFVIVRKNPYKFYYGLIQAVLTACATASTAAALPVTFRCMSTRLHVDSRITRFVLPIGCNINMDGTAMFIAVATIFIAQMNSIQLGFGELCTVFLTSTAASCSSASVPSAAMVLLLVVLTAIDAPTHDVSLLFAIDWFVDRMRTSNNMLGDCYAAAIVEHLSKKELLSCDAATLYQDAVLDNGQAQSDVETDILDTKEALLKKSVIADMHFQRQTANNANNPILLS